MLSVGKYPPGETFFLLSCGSNKTYRAICEVVEEHFDANPFFSGVTMLIPGTHRLLLILGSDADEDSIKRILEQTGHRKEVIIKVETMSKNAYHDYAKIVVERRMPFGSKNKRRL